MQLKSFIVAIVAAVGVFAQAPDPSIDTPSGVTECLPVRITFQGSSPPFIITVQPGGQAGAAPLTTIGTTSENAITWTCNLPAGTQGTLVIRDSIGRTNPSAPFTVLAGAPGCLAGLTNTPAVSTPAGGASTAPASTPANTPANTPTTTPAGNSQRPTNTQGAASVSSAAPSATRSNAANAVHPMGVAGLLGIVGAAALF